jgi:hypothetical protein
MTKKHSHLVPVPSIPKLSEGQLEPLFRRLNLAHTRRIYQEAAERAEKENWSYRDFLALLLAEEVAHRKQTRLQRCTRQAHFPFFKTIDEFDFTLQSTLRQSLLGSYLGPDFVTEGRSLILYGKTGRGKLISPWPLAIAPSRMVSRRFAPPPPNSSKIYPTPAPKVAYSNRC